MNPILIFPFKAEDDNTKAFAFTLEFARKSNAKLIALTSLNLNWKHLEGAYNLENLLEKRKNEIYCSLLEMKGYYHGRFNQWNSFDDVEMDVKISENDINGSICSLINEYENPMVVIHQKNFSGSGLCEEILSNPFLRDTRIFLLPLEREFEPPPPDLLGIVFQNLKKSTLLRLFSEIKIFDLPEEYYDFRQHMIIQQAV